jgi:hypothetical protein
LESGSDGLVIYDSDDHKFVRLRMDGSMIAGMGEVERASAEAKAVFDALSASYGFFDGRPTMSS